jgi:hypothetical protein
LSRTRFLKLRIALLSSSSSTALFTKLAASGGFGCSVDWVFIFWSGSSLIVSIPVSGCDCVLRVSSGGGGDGRVVDLRWGRRKGTVALEFFFFLFSFLFYKELMT